MQPGRVGQVRPRKRRQRAESVFQSGWSISRLKLPSLFDDVHILPAQTLKAWKVHALGQKKRSFAHVGSATHEDMPQQPSLSLAQAQAHRGVTSSQFSSKHLFLIMSSRVIASSAVGGGATRVARSTSTLASNRLRATNNSNNSQAVNSDTFRQPCGS